MLSGSVANGIRLTQGAEAEETVKFVEQFNNFFDCLNVSNSRVGKQTRNVFKNPYRSANDFRLKVRTVYKCCACAISYKLYYSG